MMTLAQGTAMSARMAMLWPELAVLAGAMVVCILGLSRRRSMRRAVGAVAATSLLVALALTWTTGSVEEAHGAGVLLPGLARFVKSMVCVVGLVLLCCGTGFVDHQHEHDVSVGAARFDPLRIARGEFTSFFLFSLAGVMLVTDSADLIWLFLALELVSLPTYVMVAIGRNDRSAQESAVKYFFLGALATAVFLYGFALLYGATGSLQLNDIRDVLTAQAAGAGLSGLAMMGTLLVVLGLCFKVTAVPMHFYAPDVYQGATTSVTAFLSFVPKAAGLTALVIILSLVGWSGHSFIDSDGARVAYQGLPQPIAAVLWMVAVLTMTLGNIGGLLQRSVKRTMAYSSIAHSGYMVIGLIAGPGAGLSALFFYLFSYGVMNGALFASLCALERRGDDLDHFDELGSMRQRFPWLAAALTVAAASLVGLPPVLGFFAKLALFMGAFEADQIGLVVIAVINSAISGWYYLRFVLMPIVAPASARSDEVQRRRGRWATAAAIACTAALILLPIATTRLLALASSAVQTDLLDSRVPHP